MKKILLLSIASLTMLMADFTLIGEQLTPVNESAQETVPPAIEPSTGTSKYLEPVTLPECNANNPEVQFIRSNADWSTINSSSKRIFCVSPGNYTALNNIKLTASGTAEKRRYILLNNGNDTHPGKLNKSQLANFALEFEAASYWTIDRAVSFDVGFTHSFLVGKSSTHNIFNRMFTQNIFHTMWIRDGAHYNTIQNSRFDGITRQGAEADLATINCVDWAETYSILGTKVINNEFINVKAFRLNRFPKTHTGNDQFVNYAGAIFDSNTVEFNDAVRTDCNGNYDPNGECIAGEANGIGVKSGSDDPSKPIIISNNKMWGYRPSDPTFENLSNKGSFVTAYYGAKDVHLLNNVVFNGTVGIMLADREDRERGTWDAVIRGNIIVDCGARARASGSYPLSVTQAEGALVESNLIKNSIGPWARVKWNMYNNSVQNNIAINSGGPLEYGENWEAVAGINTNSDRYTTAEEAGYTEDFVFTTDKFTNNPIVITLQNVVKPN